MADVALETAPHADRAYVRLRVAMRDAEESARLLVLPVAPLTLTQLTASRSQRCHW